MAEQGRHFLVAERNDHLLGLAVVKIARGSPLVPSSNPAELERLYILDRFSRVGLGSKMLQSVERECLDRGVADLWLTTWIGNSRALKFYERSGYRDMGPTYFAHAGARYENRLLAKSL